MAPAVKDPAPVSGSPGRPAAEPSGAGAADSKSLAPITVGPRRLRGVCEGPPGTARPDPCRSVSPRTSRHPPPRRVHRRSRPARSGAQRRSRSRSWWADRRGRRLAEARTALGAPTTAGAVWRGAPPRLASAADRGLTPGKRIEPMSRMRVPPGGCPHRVAVVVYNGASAMRGSNRGDLALATRWPPRASAMGWSRSQTNRQGTRSRARRPCSSRVSAES